MLMLETPYGHLWFSRIMPDPGHNNYGWAFMSPDMKTVIACSRYRFTKEEAINAGTRWYTFFFAKKGMGFGAY